MKAVAKRIAVAELAAVEAIMDIYNEAAGVKAGEEAEAGVSTLAAGASAPGAQTSVTEQTTVTPWSVANAYCLASHYALLLSPPAALSGSSAAAEAIMDVYDDAWQMHMAIAWQMHGKRMATA